MHLAVYRARGNRHNSAQFLELELLSAGPRVPCGQDLRAAMKQLPSRARSYPRCRPSRCINWAKRPNWRRSPEDARAGHPAERFGEPLKAFKVEEVGAGRAAAGRGPGLRDGRRRQLQQRLGGAGHPDRRHQGAPEDACGRHDRLPHRRLRRLAASCGRSAGTSRTSRSATRSSSTAACGSRDDPRFVKAGNDPMFAPSFQHLGLRDELGQLRAVHQGPGAPVPAQAEAPDVGGGGRVHARRRDRVPHAARLAAAQRRAGRRRARLGRRRRPRLDGDPDRARGGRASGRGGLGRRQDRVLQEARRGRLHRPQQVRPLGHAAALDATTRRTASGSRARAPSAPRSGRRSASSKNPRIVFEHPGEDHDADVDASCARPAAWS